MRLILWFVYVAAAAPTPAPTSAPTATPTCPDACDQTFKLFLTTDAFPDETTSKNIYDNVVFNIACVAVGVASAAVGLFLVAVDAGKSAGIDCLSLPSRASSAPEEKEADELEPASPASL